MERKATISILARVLLLLAAALFMAVQFVPMWYIDLDAPQYPEGLTLLIYPDKIGGNVDIINGLNHYIGMKTLHTQDFIEFRILPWLIGIVALFTLITVFAARKKALTALLVFIIAFGVVAIVDFWRWEYNYGHNLDPNAAIVVPGMAYQPPLIGFKQLLNFGAYSAPAAGGWMFIGGGLLVLLATLKETVLNRKKVKVPPAAMLLALLSGLFTACSGKGPEPIALNKDNCDYCKMSISNMSFASEIVTVKGRAYKFDDLACLIHYKNDNFGKENVTCYTCDFITPSHLIRLDSLFFIRGEMVKSPMGGNIAAFTNPDSAQVYSGRLNAIPQRWDQLLQEN